MALKRFLQLLIWRMEQIGLIWWLLLAIVFACCTVILWKNRRKGGFSKLLIRCVFFYYLLLVLVATVLTREALPSSYALVSLDISAAWKGGPGVYGMIDTVSELITNILAYVPFGFLLKELLHKSWAALGASFFISLFCETLQLVTKRGFFELSDLLLNFIGAVLGCLVFWLLQRYREKRACRFSK